MKKMPANELVQWPHLYLEMKKIRSAIIQDVARLQK